jgi:uncharacterized protein (TIGR01777 family)
MTTTIALRSEMPVGAEALFAWHERPGALERLIPPWMPARIVDATGGIRDGARVTLAIPVGPATVRWEAEHVGYRAGVEFRDVQRAGPFAGWEHVHRVEPLGGGHSALEDSVTYRLPLAPLGTIAGSAFVRDRVERLLRWRHALTRADLARHAAFAAEPRRTVAVTGATGMIGSALVPFLRTGGHAVRTVGRGPRSDVRWDPARRAVDEESLRGCDAVIHLAGENIAGRWTPARRREIRRSRVEGTRLIAETCAAMEPRPEVLICASAIGAYGDRGDAWLDESSAWGDDFLAGVVRDWEEAAEPARAAGIRVVHLRTGVVLSAAGGALARMLTPFRLGAGGRLGSGRQWMSWVSREDVIGAMHFAMLTRGVRGPVNVVAPEPVTNATFASTLGRVLHRPSIAPVPALALRALFGEMADGTILASQRVRPRALEAAGFACLHPTLVAALRFELGLA